LQDYFDSSEEIGTDISYEGLKSWNLAGLSINKILLKDEFHCFNLFVMDPLDICITKLARYNPDDVNDIREVLSHIKPNRKMLEVRFAVYLNRLKNKKKKI
jgi:hypothetical protein